MIILILGYLATVSASPTSDNKESYKNQFCTDPRTMRKHAAYTEWADAYSCTRHRCQPGGRNLAIYTVGCKRVEAPESAIECEEVVEDTNMQFPFCCTRLRCLVVVRGEVWTRVLGQPWEVLPAAPWSHMYKMKKPPPTDTTFIPKTNNQGPVYELSDSESDAGGHEKVLRSGKKPVSDNPECNEIMPRAAPPPPDIVIALSTNSDAKEVSPKKYESTRRSHIKPENSRHKRNRKTTSPPPAQYFEEVQEREREKHAEPEVQDIEETPTSTEMPQDVSEEKVPANNHVDSQKSPQNLQSAYHQVAWTEIPPGQWNDQHEGLELENRVSEHKYHDTQLESQPPEVQEGLQQLTSSSAGKEEKPANLQALVDAIGTRMRDIENVVQKMSDKVHQVKPGEGSSERRIKAEQEKRHKRFLKIKRPSVESHDYRRFSLRDRASKYLHSTDSTTEQPLFIGETNLTGYFSDASNSVLRRNVSPKEPPPMYMAPVENRRKTDPHIPVITDLSEDLDKKRKKHSHKKKNKKSRTHKKHSRGKDDKRKHYNRLNSGDIEKNNIVSLEDSSALANK